MKNFKKIIKSNLAGNYMWGECMECKKEKTCGKIFNCSRKLFYVCDICVGGKFKK